jgi:hypothetical protein
VKWAVSGRAKDSRRPLRLCEASPRLILLPFGGIPNSPAGVEENASGVPCGFESNRGTSTVCGSAPSAKHGGPSLKRITHADGWPRKKLYPSRIIFFAANLDFSQLIFVACFSATNVICLEAMSSLTAAAAAAQILSDTMKALNALRERAQRSKDSDLKDRISTLYDNFLSLKEAILRMAEEITELKRKIVQQEQKAPEPELRQVGAVNYYFLGDKGPYCQPCYDTKQKLFMLTPVEDWNEGLRRQCLVCERYFYERPIDDRPAFTSVNWPK